MSDPGRNPEVSSFIPSGISGAASAIGDRFSTLVPGNNAGSSFLPGSGSSDGNDIDGVIAQMNQNLDEVVAEFTSNNDNLSQTQAEIMKAVEMIIGLSANLSKATNDTTIKKLTQQLTTQRSKLATLNSQLDANMKTSQSILDKMNGAANGGMAGGRKRRYKRVMRGGWTWDDSGEPRSELISSPSRYSLRKKPSGRSSSSGRKSPSRKSKTRSSSGGGKRGTMKRRKRR